MSKKPKERWNEEESKKWKICPECDSVGSKLIMGVLCKCPTCKGTGTVRK